MTTTAVSTYERFLHNMGIRLSSALLRQEAADLHKTAYAFEQQAASIQSNLSGLDEAIAEARSRIDLARQRATNAQRPIGNLTEAEANQLAKVDETREAIARLQQLLVEQTDELSLIAGKRLDAIVAQSDEEVELAAAQNELSELNLRKANATSGLEVQISQLNLKASRLRTQAANILAEAARIDAKKA